MRSAITSRTAILLGAFLALAVALLTIGATTAHASGSSVPGASVRSGGSSSGGQGSAYTWKVYGTGKQGSAWKAFVNSSYKPCGTNCRADFAGHGSYNWKSIAPECKDSGYIWAKVLKEGYINQHGYAQSGSSIAKSIPKTAKGSSYAGYHKELTYLLNHSNVNKYFVVTCSGLLG